MEHFIQGHHAVLDKRGRRGYILEITQEDESSYIKLFSLESKNNFFLFFVTHANLHPNLSEDTNSEVLLLNNDPERTEN